MLFVIGYDVNTTSKEGIRRLNKVARICCNYGQRVQNSLFECSLNEAQYVKVRSELLSIINKTEDSLRIYKLGNKHNTKTEHYGAKESYDPEGVLLL